MTSFSLTVEKIIGDLRASVAASATRTCELCGCPGGDMLPCSHAACENCRIDGECYRCFAGSNPGTPVVVHMAGRKGFTVIWSDDKGAREAWFAREQDAYWAAVYVLSGVSVSGWDRRAMRWIVRVAVDAVRRENHDE